MSNAEQTIRRGSREPIAGGLWRDGARACNSQIVRRDADHPRRRSHREAAAASRADRAERRRQVDAVQSDLGSLRAELRRILLNGQSIAGFPPHVINRRGLSRSFQITNVFPRMWWRRICAFRSWAGMAIASRCSADQQHEGGNDEVDEMVERLRLTKRRNDLAGDLAYSEQRRWRSGCLWPPTRSC